MKNKNLDIHTIERLHRSGDLDAAKKGYLAFLRKNPRDAETLHALGILCAQQENYADAIAYLQSAVKLQPNNLALILHLANILKFQGLYNDAILMLQNAIVLNPDYTPALNNLGTVYYAQGKWNEAITYYRQAIAKQPDYVDAYYNLGLALNKQTQFGEAITTYQKLLTLAPEHFAARFHLACVYMQQDKFADAIQVFLQIEENHPNHFETQTNLATCYLKLGKLNEAKLHYFKALELTPEDTQILFNLGVINMQQGQVDIAIQHYQRAALLKPDDFALQNNLGVAFLAKQHAGFALRHFQEALRIQPGNAAIQHTIKILSKHQNLFSSPPEYVKSLFDSYADHYEPHLLNALDYKIPQLLLDAVLRIAKPAEKSWDILDLGCGTGLCGTPFKPYAKNLVGVDLSTKMLEIAAQKQIYTELASSDLTTFLADKNAQYDLIIAGDVLVYIGDLADLFAKTHTALRNKGLFAFNTEITEDAEFKMTQSGRFSHQKKYLEKLAADNHYKILNYQSVITRMQNNEPVHGHLFILQKT